MQESFSPCYSMSNRFRGHAVIISNETFKNFPGRPGAKQDALKMQALFKSLDFHVSTYMNLGADEMRQLIKTASESDFNVDSDCFVLVMSSHGHEVTVSESRLHVHLPNDASVWRHAIVGSDGENIYLDEIFEWFDDKIVEQSLLKDKPKLFFIQACQTGHLSFRNGGLASSDTGAYVQVRLSDTDVSNIQASDANIHEDYFVDVVKSQPECDVHFGWRAETDSWLQGRKSTLELKGTLPDKVEGETVVDPGPVQPRQVCQSSYDIVPVTCPDDCFVMYPTMPGKFAYRHNSVGSYMLHYMCQPNIRNLLLNGYDILHLFMAVNSEMANTEVYFTEEQLALEEQELKQQMPLKVTACLIHRLRKSLKFVPKKTDSVMAKMRTMPT